MTVVCWSDYCCQSDACLRDIEHRLTLRETVGIAAAVVTLADYTSGLFYGFSLRVLYSVHLFGQFTRNYCTHILSIYMGLVARQVDN
jgi:hypothetical protein